MLSLEPWDESGFAILEASNTPEMTLHLGGPESPEKLADRHRRYLAYASSHTEAWPFRVLLDREAVGSVGYWGDEETFEMGWATLPAFQGRGLARAAIGLALDHAAANGLRKTVAANPSVSNLASNAVARAAGFELHGPHDIEYPKGQFMRANLWVYDLRGREGRAQLGV